ncbi:MAG: ATP-dependent DNA helicase RecG [Candidatus Staskawiczbacteria bacterium RIFCSPLOWO2_01_FULL_38_12b]|uniref:ATP-dependent DNA helicase RecG n=1 Tax=Candidatus Staskawiczbacteria bacterium RIFCSPLOWO2_01_FULL_38_12b TaxID=1802214 RepID=A0A1G2IEG3_9BACT|nr:MAG: ATP-dependent DNA helicase RecG [Candidatus Staskawiczbacteria bacterium RIFCSPLOWO2_01_FULL_38_12b]
MELSTPIEDVPNIGSAYHKKLKKLGIKTVQDLLFYFPLRYEDFSNIIPIKDIKVGEVACVQGRIIEIENTQTFKKYMTITEALVEDETGSIKALWFNQPFLTKSLKEDDFVCLAGKVTLSKNGVYLNNPVFEKISDIDDNPSTSLRASNLTHTGRIIPVYSETKGVSSKWLRYMIKPLLEYFFDKVGEILPEEILKKHKFLAVKEAIWQIHFPDSFEAADAAKARFSFEDLFLLQLSILKQRAKLMQKTALACAMDAKLMKEFTESLPFQLTDSQKQCSYQILKDLEKSVPMSRLLEGDVGSGKTVVATMAALSAVKNGYQVAFMAPTEILTSQHFKGISKMLEKFGTTIGYLTGKESFIYKAGKIQEIKKKDLLLELEFGQINILIGTHSLIQKTIKFSKLALVILDEQHRFGVSQRAQLIKDQKIIPHLLSMTATPIPRTLALTVYGDLDLSLIKEMPKNRKKIKTVIVDPKDRKAAYEFIQKEVRDGKGVFVICPKIGREENENSALPITGSFAVSNYNPSLFGVLEMKTVKQEYEKLSKEIFPDLRITMLHGKMKTEEKQRVMLDFKKGEIDILVSTSVVEVGVDVPRATVMMIEGAERFGLAQLHQFRGRVGRSDMQSYCFLFTTSPDQLNRKRLKALVDSDNGFELAQKDLEIRGPGQLYGAQQWGLPDVAMEGMLNIFLVEKTRTAAKEILEKDPELKGYPLLLEQLGQFKSKIHFE